MNLATARWKPHAGYHQWEVWARSSQRELASSNVLTSTTALRQKQPFDGRFLIF
jgi:hypothetical protein